jgi:hypothetical protein
VQNQSRSLDAVNEIDGIERVIGSTAFVGKSVVVSFIPAIEVARAVKAQPIDNRGSGDGGLEAVGLGDRPRSCA